MQDENDFKVLIAKGAVLLRKSIKHGNVNDGVTAWKECCVLACVSFKICLTITILNEFK